MAWFTESKSKILVFLLLTSTPAYAGMQAGLGIDLLQFSYAEQLPPGQKSTESGLLYLIRADFTLGSPGDKYRWRFGVDFSFVPTNYDGTTGLGVPVTGTTNNSFLLMESDLADRLLSFHAGVDMELSAYAGLGFRVWVRQLGDAAGAPNTAYNEDYSWVVLPIGVQLRAVFSPVFSWTLDAALRPSFFGNIAVYVPGVSGSISMGLGACLGARIEAPARYEWNDRWSFALSPWYEYSAIGQSDPDYINSTQYIYEPSSTTQQFGIGVKAYLYL